MDKKVSELKRHLHELNFYPNRKKGQNFLYDRLVIDQIVESVLSCKTNNIVEIGPGLGALSDRIDECLKSPQYKMIELDCILFNYLVKKGYFGQVFLGDCLKLDWFSLTNTTDFLFFGNLPYNCGTLILIKWLNYVHSQVAVFMLQKEVVERLLASPGQKEYSSLSVITQLSADVLPLISVPPTAFYPEPKVESVVIKLIKRKILDPKLGNFIRRCFVCKRKTLFNNLRQFYPESQILGALHHFGLKEKIRAEEMQIAVFVDLYRYFSENL